MFCTVCYCQVLTLKIDDIYTYVTFQFNDINIMCFDIDARRNSFESIQCRKVDENENNQSYFTKRKEDDQAKNTKMSRCYLRKITNP